MLTTTNTYQTSFGDNDTGVRSSSLGHFVLDGACLTSNSIVSPIQILIA